MNSTTYQTIARPDRLKRCTTCREWLPMECYSKDSQSPDNHSYNCRACKSERRAELRAGDCKRFKPWGRRKALCT